MPTTPSPSQSEFSSRLPTPFSRSPSPGLDNPYLPTPPSSQRSVKGSSTPHSLDGSTLSTTSDRDGPPPTKRRKVSEKSSQMPREPRRLDLERIAHDHTLESNIQLDRLLKALRKKRKIVVVAGAGISVSAGIPDFRSSTGLFKSLKETHNLKGSGKQLFDAGVYRDAASTSTFHRMVREMSTMSTTAQPTPFHHLVARLAHEGRLLRFYTQNVDGLENKLDPLRTEIPLRSKAPWPKTVQLHGGLEKMICSKCKDTSDFRAELFDQDLPPECSGCQELDRTRTEVAGKRSHGIGRLRPRMTLYNEVGPDDDAIGSCAKQDLKTRPDCVLVVGTTLSVPGVRRIAKEMCAIVRDRKDGLTAWINLDPEPTGKDLENSWDLIVTGTADDVATRANLGHWDDPEEIVEAVKDDDVQKVDVHVAIPSPSKPQAFFDPVLDAAMTNQMEEAKAVVVKKSKKKAANPASKGRKINDVLGQDATVAGKKTRKPRTAKPKTNAKGVGKGASSSSNAQSKSTDQSSATTATSSIKLSFKTTKATSNGVALEKKRCSSDTENAGDKEEPRSPIKKRPSKELDEVPEVDERVNSATKSPLKSLISPIKFLWTPQA